MAEQVALTRPSRAIALVLDTEHCALLVDAALFAIDVPADQQALPALRAAAARNLGVDLGVVLGRRLVAGDAWFVFVVCGLTPRDSGALVPLRTWSQDPALAGAWEVYVDAMLGGWEPPTRELDAFYFGGDPAIAAQLAHLVVKGDKRATTCWLAAAEREDATLPHVGTVSIVTDGYGIPLCAIETVRVERSSIRDTTAEFAAAEGEGDLSLADWRATHRACFAAEAVTLGIAFDDNSELLQEYFRVLRVLAR